MEYILKPFGSGMNDQVHGVRNFDLDIRLSHGRLDGSSATPVGALQRLWQGVEADYAGFRRSDCEAASSPKHKSTKIAGKVEIEKPGRELRRKDP